MKISELSRRSGVPLATIKFYQRERLLPPGTATAPNQARYDERHVRRLALIRALRETGGLSLATIGRIVAALDAHDVPIHALVGEVVDSLGEENRRAASAEPEREAAAADVDRFLAGQGLPVRAEGTARGVLIDALVTLRWRVTPGLPVETFAPCDQYSLEGDALSLAIRGEAPLLYGVEDAIQNMQIIDALFASQRSGRWEAV